jgi:ferric-dicitrate binding protein FerR (iron transport regulator)
MDLRARRLLKKLVSLLGTDNEEERDSAWRRIDEILKKHKRAWAEMHELIGNIPEETTLDRRRRPMTTDATSGCLTSWKACCVAMCS